MNRFEEENFEVGYWTNNLPVNPGGFQDEDYKFEEENFKNNYSYRTNNSSVNLGDFWNEDLMPQDHFRTEAPFGYSSQTLNITEGNLINQTGQNLEVVDDIIESSDSQAFEKVFQDAVPQMVNILKQATIAINSTVGTINNTL